VFAATGAYPLNSSVGVHIRPASGRKTAPTHASMNCTSISIVETTYAAKLPGGARRADRETIGNRYGARFVCAERSRAGTGDGAPTALTSVAKDGYMLRARRSGRGD
jgi:hypothetical protein